MFRLLSALAVIAFPLFALADMPPLVGGPCDSQGECPLAFTCETVEVGCDTPIDDCVCRPCPEGEPCAPCECDDTPVDDNCAPTTEQRCVLHMEACTTDADCSTPGFVCNPGPDCGGGGGCDCPPCAPGTECAPCSCEDEEPADCGGGEGYCLPDIGPCTADSDCDAGWECADMGGSGDGGDCETCACTVGPDGEELCDCGPCDTPEPGGGPSSGGGADEESGGSDSACEECACGSGPDGEEICECAPCEESPMEEDAVCLPNGWAEQLSYFGGAEDDGGVGAPRGDGAELGGSNGGRVPVDGDGAGCSSAGGAGSAFAIAAALFGLVRRRR